MKLTETKRSLTITKAFFLIILGISLEIGDSTLFAQQNVSNDWKITTAGNVRMVIFNRARIYHYGTDYPGLVDVEYPPESGEEHIGSCGIVVAGIKPDGTIGLSNGEHMHQPDEFWPSEAPWDTIWVIDRNDDPVDIGGEFNGVMDIYWPGYKAVSDQDFVCRYNDYNILNPFGGHREQHNPLYIEIIQTVYTWGTFPLYDVVLYSYYITPTKFDIEGMMIGFQNMTVVGKADQNPRADDRQLFFPEYHMIVCEDGPNGMDGTAVSNIGFQMFAPDIIPAEDIVWTWFWNNDIWFQPSSDIENYESFYKTGMIMNNQETYDGGISYLSMYFPGFVNVGDTLKFQMALVFSKDGTEGILHNADILSALKLKDFKVPAAPPAPPLQVEEMNKSVRLIWTPTAAINPEIYQDPSRLDTVAQPFEGYRVYKSTLSRSGPWTLLAEYDVPGNEYGQNTGLFHDYTDIGLLNNVEYHYAVTSYSKPDTVIPWQSMESSIYLSSITVVPGTATPSTVGQVAAVPNPYRADVNYRDYNPPWEKPPSGRNWMPQDRRIQFINLPEKCTIKIYTVAGDFVAEIFHDNPARGYEDWNLTSYVDQAIASGIYMFSVEDDITGDVQIGKFVVIK